VSAAPSITERAGYIGGSDAAAILGLSPYASPFQCFASKVGVDVPQSADPVRDEKFFWGHELEAAIARGFSKRTGIKVQRSKEPFYRSEKYPFMGGHLDFELADGSRTIVECKNIEFFGGDWGEPNPLDEDSSDLVPLYYLAQCDHYMVIRDAPCAYLIALFGGCRLRIYRINRARTREELLVRAEEIMWDRVQRDDPPPFTGVDDIILGIKSGYIESYDATKAKKAKAHIQLDKVGMGLVTIAAGASRKLTAAKAEREVARRALLEWLKGRSGYLYVGDEKQGSFLVGERETFDHKSLEIDDPVMHKRYLRKSMYGPSLRLVQDAED
jgi:putative phage-type endonuclease